MTPIDIFGWSVVLIVFLLLAYVFVMRSRHAAQDSLEQHWPEDDYDEGEPGQLRGFTEDELRRGIVVRGYGPLSETKTEYKTPEHDWVIPAVMLGAVMLDHEHDSVGGGTLIDPRPEPNFTPADLAPTQCQADGYSGSDTPANCDTPSTPSDSGTSVSDASSGSYDSSSSGSDYSSGSYDSSSSGSDMGSGSDGSSGW